jgi:hypothetical protein
MSPLSGFSKFWRTFLLQSYHLFGVHFSLSFFPFPLSTLNLNGFARAGWLREALRWKARKGGSRWGRGDKKASL